MTTELLVLALAALLQALQLSVLAIVAGRELGVQVTLGSRDRTPEMSPRLGRMYRAFNNHNEALILFTMAVIVTTLADQTSLLTALCAWAYLVARIAYVPVYVLGLTPWRSVVWSVAFAATLLMILAALV